MRERKLCLCCCAYMYMHTSVRHYHGIYSRMAPSHVDLHNNTHTHTHSHCQQSNITKMSYYFPTYIVTSMTENTSLWDKKFSILTQKATLAPCVDIGHTSECSTATYIPYTVYIALAGYVYHKYLCKLDN